jgi:glucan 1,3-beta-glucosidase
VGGALIGWSIDNVPIESLGFAGWLRSLAFVGVALLTPPTLGAAVVRRTPLPRFSSLIGPAAGRVSEPIARLAGALLIATMMLALVSAFGLVFDPRYKDFPFAPLTAAAFPFLMHSLVMPRPHGRVGAAEIAGAGMLALSVPYIAINESFANWQSLWLCAAFAALAFSLARVRGAQS